MTELELLREVAAAARKYVDDAAPIITLQRALAALDQAPTAAAKAASSSADRLLALASTQGPQWCASFIASPGWVVIDVISRSDPTVTTGAAGLDEAITAAVEELEARVKC